ncbi:E3 ubiquitin-protein ligase RHA2A-like [Senna tora]|uniref:E3 ubiquitin-protein ligase RHA2A-like n=1 Tax=Senna tora TaxID=362788 RepID=A0A834SS16_9FABA|nr:E3 ubiquitin-protein ligase RHA2A-like [Senna tora]
MGLQNQLSDFSSGSIPLLLLAQIANCINYLRSFLLAFLRSLGLSRFHSNRVVVVDDAFLTAVGSGFAGLIIFSEQLHANRNLSDSFVASDDDSKCVVCRSKYREGDLVRRLPCRHVFHRGCFDGWLDQLKFNCPLCRSPLVSDERVALTERRVGTELLSWFSLQ